MENLNVILTEDQLKEAVAYFLTKPAFAFDVEAVGEFRGSPLFNTVTWLSMATQGMCVVIPFGHPNGSKTISKATRKKIKETGKFDMIPAVYDAPPEQLRPGKVFELLRPLFFSDKIKIAHNAQYDFISVVKYFGELPPGPYCDTIVQQWLLDENIKSKKLKDLIKVYYKFQYDFVNTGKQVEIHPFNKVARYSYLDSKYTWLLYEQFRTRIIEAELTDIFNLESELLTSLFKIAMTGAPVDTQRLKELEVILADKLVEVEGNIYKSAGSKFNINSPAQKAKVLYAPKDGGGQALKPWKLTDGGLRKEALGSRLNYVDYSTDAETLESYTKNPVAKHLIEYAEVSKLLNTYIRGYLGDPDDSKKPCRVFDGRIHAELVQYGTVTGRFSCREPNLQNIPTPSTELGKQIRGLFVAPPAHKLIVADYGQIELVVLASYCNGGRLYDGFLKGVDAHTATAAGVFGITPEEVTKAQRSIAKALNFAIVYGAGPNKVAAMADITVTQAKKFMAAHERQFPEIYKFKKEVLRQARTRRPPHIKTILGRKRRVPFVNSGDNGVRLRGERQLFNSLIQGGAADLIKLAMIRLDKTLPDSMKLILSVHDELVVTAPEGEVEEAIRVVREAMEGAGISELLNVPPKAQIVAVDRWSDAK